MSEREGATRPPQGFAADSDPPYGHDCGPDCTCFRKRVYQVERTVTERFFYDPDEIKRTFGWAARGFDDDKTFEEFVVAKFEEHDGSQYGDSIFYSDANPQVGIDLIERWDDE